MKLNTSRVAGNKVKIFVTGVRGCWRANFKIGVQTFNVCERETKKEALWFCKCLRTAFKNLGEQKSKKGIFQISQDVLKKNKAKKK